MMRQHAVIELRSSAAKDPAIVRAEVQAAEEAARAAAALQQLQQAAKDGLWAVMVATCRLHMAPHCLGNLGYSPIPQDGAYAQWTLRRHGLRSAASAESNRRAQDAETCQCLQTYLGRRPSTSTLHAIDMSGSARS